MNNIGIGINVDLKQAKREIDIFNRDINKACQDRDMSIGVDSSEVTNTSALLTKLREEISRIGELSRASTNRGGLLRKEQFAEAADMIKRVQGGFTKWTDEINNARRALKSLVEERKDLQYTMGQVMAGKERLSPAQLNTTTDRLEAVDAEEKATRDRLAHLKKERDRVDQLQDRARRYSDVLGGSGVDADKTTLHLGVNLKKALGFGLAAAGGFSLLGFLGASRAKYQQSVGHQVNLGGRGVGGDDNAGVGVGMGPLEFMALKESMSQTGLKGSQVQGASRLAAAFGRANGVDPSQVGGMYGSMYQATGHAELGANALIMIDSVKKGMDKARMSELMNMVARNTNVTAQAMGGAGATDGQALKSVLLATQAMKLGDNVSYKQYMKSAEFHNVFSSGLQGAGSPAGEIMLWNAVGGFKGEMNYEKIHEMNIIRQGGFKEHPELLSGLLGQLSGSKKSKAGQLETLFPEWRTKGVASEKLVEFAGSQTFRDYSAQAKRLDGAKPGTVEGKAIIAKFEKEYGALVGSDKQRLEALRETVHIEAGEKLNDIFGKFETHALKFADALADQRWKSAFDIFGKAAADMGPVSKTLLLAGGLYTTGGAMNMVGGAMNMVGGATSMMGGGKGALLKMLPGLMGVGGPLAALAAGYGLSYSVFKDGAQGGNYLQERDKKALTGKAPIGENTFDGRLNRLIAKDPWYSNGYKQHAVTIAATARKYGVPEHLLAGLLESESDFKNVNPRSVKLKSGKSITVGGIAQLSGDTAKRYGADMTNPGQSIDAAGHYMSDIYSRAGNWRDTLAEYKGVKSPDKMYQVDSAFMKAEKYTTTREPERLAMNPSTITDSSLQLLTDLLKVIAGHSEQTALNTGAKPITATPLAIR